jgi:anti-sigma regulatory factor (Ser/Thr protein kinase)
MSAQKLRLPADARAAAVARAALDRHLGALSRGRRADARLLVTELVTNALRHGRPPIELTVGSDERRLRVEVEDAGGGRPARRPDPGADGGWGLLLVESAADRWGVADGSTHVWFEIDGA